VKEKISIGFDHVERALLPAALDLDPQPRQTEEASRGAATYVSRASPEPAEGT
jgi:hypothetical protein